MPGALSSARRDSGDVNLTGGASTSTSPEFQQADREVRRSVHSDRPQRIGDFAVDGRPPTAKALNQKSMKLSNLHAKESFKARRKRK